MPAKRLATRMSPGGPLRHELDYLYHGTTSYVASLDLVTGKDIARVTARSDSVTFFSILICNLLARGGYSSSEDLNKMSELHRTPRHEREGPHVRLRREGCCVTPLFQATFCCKGRRRGER